MKAVLTGFAENANVHGPGSIYRSEHKLRRLIWVLLFLTGLALLMYQLSYNIMHYLSKPVTTSIKTHSGNLDQIFPMIVLCNGNPAIWSEIGHYLTETDEWSALTNQTDYSGTTSTAMEYADVFEMTYARFSDNEKMLMGHRIEEMMLSCM